MGSKKGATWKSKELDIPSIIAWYIDGDSTETIAKRLHCGNRTIARRLRAAGVEIRKQPWELKGSESPFFKGARTKAHGYWYIYAPTHPRADKRGRVLESVQIAEQRMGRLLRDDEVVHHIDENPDNNAEENLLVLTRGQHICLHNKLRAIRGEYAK